MWLLCPLLLMLACCAMAVEVPWFERTLIGMEVGPSGRQGPWDAVGEGYGAEFNGAAIVAAQVEAGSEYLVIWGRDGDWAFYDSKLMPKCPGLGERDPLREAADAAKEAGLPLIVYCVVQSGGHALAEHPEWGMAGLDRQPIPGRVCLNSGYRDYVMALLDEMLAYDIDGFHIDMVDQGFGPPYGCCCDVCRPLFEKQYGHAMPASAGWDEAWDHFLAFRYDTSARFERDVKAHVQADHPDVSVDYNYHGYPPFSFEVGQRPVQHAHIGDFVTCESGVWGFGALAAAMTAEFVRASGPGRPYQVVMQRGCRFYHDQTTRPLNDLRWEMFALLAHGAQVTVVDKTPYSGALDPVAYGRIAEVFREVRGKREHFGHEPLYDAGIYYSVRSRDWYGREERWKYLDAFLGAHKACAYEHIAAGFVLDESLALEALRAFPVVVLSHTAIVTEREAEVFTAYVEQGGRLLVTGETGLYDTMGNPREESPLRALVGARAVRRAASRSNYVRLQHNCGLDRDIPADWPHLVHGPAVVYAPEGAEPLGELLLPVKDEEAGNPFPSSAGDPAGPAALLNRVGEGMVLTLAVSPGHAVAGEYRTSEARLLLRNAVRLLAPDPPRRIEAPRNVDTVVTRDPETKTTRVHFVAYLAPPGTTGEKRPWVLPDLIEDVPLYRARVRLAAPPKAARALNPETEVVVDGAEIALTIHDIHEVLVIQED